MDNELTYFTKSSQKARSVFCFDSFFWDCYRFGLFLHWIRLAPDTTAENSVYVTLTQVS